MPALSTSSHVRSWFEREPDDEVTNEVTTLGALIASPVVVVTLATPLDSCAAQARRVARVGDCGRR